MALVENMGSQGSCQINRALLPVKVHYFLFMAALAAVLPFRTIFCKQLGVPATAVGVIFMAVPFMKLVANPVIGAILDYFKRFRLILSVIMVIVALSHLAMIFVPPRDANADKLYSITANLSCALHPPMSRPEVTVTCPLPPEKCFPVDGKKYCSVTCKGCYKPSSLGQHHSWSGRDCSSSCGDASESFVLTFDVAIANGNAPTESVISNQIVNVSQAFGLGDTSLATESDTYCPCSGQLQCFSVDCNKRLRQCANTCDSNTIARNEGVFSSMQFWTLMLLMCISSVAFSSVMFIMDAVCYEILNDKPHKYGEQRLWGTAGWGLGALAGGYLNQLVTGNSEEINYAPGFYLLVAVALLDLWPLMNIKVRNVKYSPSILKDVGKLMCKFPVLYNVIMFYFTGVLSGLIWNYQFWFMEEIGSSQLLLGLSQTVECFVAEIPCFLVAGWVIKKFGHWNCLSITFACFGFRYLCFVYMYNAWLTLPVGLLHGPTFGLFYSSMTMFAKSEAPPGTEATVQALLSVSFEGVGAATGSVLGGVGFDSVGSRTTFLYAAGGSFVLLFANVFIHLFLLKRRKQGTCCDGSKASSESSIEKPSEIFIENS